MIAFLTLSLLHPMADHRNSLDGRKKTDRFLPFEFGFGFEVEEELLRLQW